MASKHFPSGVGAYGALDLVVSGSMIMVAEVLQRSMIHDLNKTPKLLYLSRFAGSRPLLCITFNEAIKEWLHLVILITLPVPHQAPSCKLANIKSALKPLQMINFHINSSVELLCTSV